MSSDAAQRVGSWVEQHQRKDLLRFLTCGSVDDGKSTLIGRLLFDTELVPEDTLQALRKDSEKHGTTGRGKVDLALLTDGLKAEREQGITIDVAYRYFATARRKFIIADCPGHEQYTRNMATGASTCNLAVILLDARQGVLPQTRRHSFIVSLLGIRHVVVAVNKMDVAGWSQERFERIRADYTAFASRLDLPDVHFIPLSALEGDNVVHRSANMPWYQGGTLLEYLETVHIASDRNLVDLRLPIQLALRPSSDFRGFAGTLASGVLRKGDEVLVLPARRRTRVRSILGAQGEMSEACAPMAVTVTLVDEVDCSRGDMLVHPGNLPALVREAEAMLVWMHEDPLVPGKEYLVRHAGGYVPGTVASVRYAVDVNTGHRKASAELGLNAIGRVRLSFVRPLALDPYARNRATGSLVLIDRTSNATVACAMVRAVNAAEGVQAQAQAAVSGAQRRTINLGHQGALLQTGASDLERAEAILLAAGYSCLVLAPGRDPFPDAASRQVAARWAVSQGDFVLTATGWLPAQDPGRDCLVLPADPDAILPFLEGQGLLGQ